MKTSVFDLFKIGIGPSSSHTVGPMRAARQFVFDLATAQQLAPTVRIKTELFGSLALTGLGHATDRAVLLGLSGQQPDQVDPGSIDAMIASIRKDRELRWNGTRPIPFDESTDLLFHRDRMFPPGGEAATAHPNGMRFTAFDAEGRVLTQQVFYSVGGGFILSAAELASHALAPGAQSNPGVSQRSVPYPFQSAAQLLALVETHRLTIAELILANECALLEADRLLERPTINRPAIAPGMAPAEQVARSILALWQAMQSSTERGIATAGILPGGLNVRRRAARLYQRALELDQSTKPRDPLAPLDWVSLFAIAVNEENAAGGRVVTAPTNGAAGVIPAVASYYARFIAKDMGPEAETAGLLRFFLTAAAIGILYKENASISGAEVGC